MAAWGYEFYLLVLKVLEDKIRIPARRVLWIIVDKRFMYLSLFVLRLWVY